MANDVNPYYVEADRITCTAAAALIGQRLCEISAARTGGGPGLVTNGLGGNITVNYPSAGGKVFGVVGNDVAQGDQVTVYREGILPILAAATLTAGAEVQTDTTGRVVALASGKAIGRVVNDVASGSVAEVLFYEA